MKIVVAGAGVAGIAASLALARAGHDVVLLDRDGMPDEGDWTASPYLSRPGCPQLNQGHAFLARGRKLLEEHAPDVLATLVDAGSSVTDGNLVLPPEYHDPDLRSLAVRRSLIDQALMRALRGEPAVRTETATITGLVEGSQRDGIPTVAGVRTKAGEEIRADLVIDASGRRSRFPELLRAIGCSPPVEQREECGVLYYGQYFEMMPDAPPPLMFTPVGARGSLDYMGFALFWQDNRIIVLGFHAPPDDHDLCAALRSEGSFTAAARAIKPLAPYVSESFSKPVSPVVMMGGLQNAIRSYVIDGRPVAHGFLAIGDSLSHTDPVYAWGMSMALDQAFRLPDLVANANGRLAVAFHEAVHEELADRYRMATRADEERTEHLAGRRPEPSMEADREFMIDVGMTLLARNDPGVLVRLLRRALALDLPSAVERDEELLEEARAAVLSSGILDKVRKPSREELLALMAAAR